MRVCLGIDVGSVTTKVAALDEADEIVASRYGRTEGRPVVAVQRLLKEVAEQLPADTEIAGVGTTGSGRYLAGAMLGADVIKNEITAHSVAASHYFPETRTILEIGGQDSKIIILRDGVVVDFAMNTVCAAGTGSFLDQQAFRLKIGIEEFGPMALQSQSPVRI
ncbi:MAG: BadF/BadG/BcrA/BcrD ATPase family protein, partial [Chloroflexota bacterium]